MAKGPLLWPHGAGIPGCSTSYPEAPSNLKPIPRTPSPAQWHERADLCQVLQVAGSCGFGGFCDRHILFSAHPAGKTFGACFKHPLEYLFLPRIERSSEIVEKTRLGNREADLLNGHFLRFQYGLQEIPYPGRDLVGSLSSFQCLVVGLPFGFNGLRDSG